MISIGIPAVKSQFLSEAIDSVISQSYNDFELILVNDRKDPVIRSIVKNYNDPRIIYYEESSVLPIVQNWNRVLSYANGEFFILFSDDDFYHTDFLSEMISLQEKYPECDIFHCRVRQVDDKGKELSLSPVCPEYETGLSFILERLQGNRIQFAPDFMTRTSQLKAIGGFTDLPLAWGSDDITWFQLSLNHGVAYSDRTLFSWRKSLNQVSRSGDILIRLDAVDQYKKWVKDFSESYLPVNETEQRLLNLIKLTYIRSGEKQKLFLLGINIAASSIKEHIRFFLKNRKKHNLKIRWIVYLIFSKIIGKATD